MNGLDSKSSEGFKSSSVGSNPTLSARRGPAGGRRRAWFAFIILLALVLPGGVFPALAGSSPIRLGIGNPVEEVLLGRLTEAVLQAEGIEVEVQSGLDPEVLRARALRDELDLFWDYTGRALIVARKNPDRAVLRDSERCYRMVSAADLKDGLVWGPMASGNNSYGVVMTTALAQKMKVETVSGLAAGAAKLYKTTRKKTILGMDSVFKSRPDGFNSLVALYGFEFNSILAAVTPPGNLLDSLRTKETQAVVGPTVDGRIRRFKLKVLKEDKPFFPAYNPAPVWRKAVLEENQTAASVLDRLAAKLDLEALNDLRFPVEIHGQDPAEAALDWLKANWGPGR